MSFPRSYHWPVEPLGSERPFTSDKDATMKCEPYVTQGDLDHQGEPGLRHLANVYAKRAAEHELEAAIARENARQCLEAAEARAAEKRTRKEQRRAQRKAARMTADR
jgi:hypothetical protein